MVRGGGEIHTVEHVHRKRGRDWPGWCKGSWQQCAAVHRHSLYRLNTINDSLKKKKKKTLIEKLTSAVKFMASNYLGQDPRSTTSQLI